MKVVIFETEQWEHPACTTLGAEHSIACVQEALNEETAAAYGDVEVVSPFVTCRLNAEVLARLPKLKLIATRSTGYDHIDLDYCRAHGVAVSNVPDYGNVTVAEHAFALLLAISRHLVDAVERTRRGNFSQVGLRGFDLHGKTLGVIGTGRIGRRAIAIAKGFGMTALAHDLYPNPDTAQGLGFRYAEFDAVLTSADVVTLHLPANPKTIGLLADREFGLMKSGAILINTARGNIVDVPSLVRALASGRLGAAGLDVLPQEPLIREEAQIFRSPSSPESYDLEALVANHILLRFPNVIVTPHNAYNTDDAVRRIIDTTLENIISFGRGEPQNVVSAA
jgi:D-lactate dehydrogenase